MLVLDLVEVITYTDRQTDRSLNSQFSHHHHRYTEKPYSGYGVESGIPVGNHCDETSVIYKCIVIHTMLEAGVLAPKMTRVSG